MESEEIFKYAVTPGVGELFFTHEQLKGIMEIAGPHSRIEMNKLVRLIVHTPESDVASQKERLVALGLRVYEVGALVSNVQTCTFCQGERVEGFGLEDARALDAAISGQPVPYAVRVGYSCCPLNCGEILFRDIGVVRMTSGRYDLYIGGRPGSLEPILGEKVAEEVEGSLLPGVAAAILQCYRKVAKGKERMWKCLKRVGVGPFLEAVQSITK